MEAILEKIRTKLRADPRCWNCSVKIDNRKIVLSGTAPSYYVKQISQEAVLQVLREHGLDVVNQIDVLYNNQ